MKYNIDTKYSNNSNNFEYGSKGLSSSTFYENLLKAHYSKNKHNNEEGKNNSSDNSSLDYKLTNREMQRLLEEGQKYKRKCPLCGHDL